jgi:quercetin dioxygenase-like cupin family protein
MTGDSATGRRLPEIQAFLDALFPCLVVSTRGDAADAAFVADLDDRLREPGQASGVRPGPRLEVLDHLDSAIDGLAQAAPSLRRLGAAFAALAPVVPWSKRRHQGPDAERFAAGHGNALIVGPGGAEERADVRLGVSLMAPHIRYPDHSHPPDELYLVLSDGEWRRGEGAWFRPGIAGTVRNPPGIVHAMRAGGAPLLAVWGLIA